MMKVSLLSLTTDQWSALGSVLGGLFTGLAFVISLALIVRESRARREDKYDEQASQARLVIPAIDEESINPSEMASDSNRWDIRGRIKNYSDAPVFEVYIGDRSNRFQQLYLSLEPGQEKDVHIKATIAKAPDGTSEMLRETGLDVTFLDAAGRRWRRIGPSAPEHVKSDFKSPGLLPQFDPEDLRRSRERRARPSDP
jgi:hypothetical protein